MKPCSKNRGQIVSLAMGALETPRQRELRAHLDNCPGCRRYLDEISAIAATVRAAEPDSQTQPSSSFHRNLVAALSAAGRPSAMQTLLAQIRSARPWQLATPAVAIAAVIAVWLVAGHRAEIPISSPVAIHIIAPLGQQTGLAPTFSNYEMAAHQSLDKLDALLTVQARLTPPTSPIYTAATFPE